MRLREHRATNPVGSAGEIPPGPPARPWWLRWRTFLAACLVSAVIGAGAGVTPQVSGTSALYTATASTQINTIKAGTWVSTPAGCTGTFTVALHSSMAGFQAALTSNAVVYLDSPGTFHFNGYVHLCLVVDVLGVQVFGLDTSVQVILAVSLGWLCSLPFVAQICGVLTGPPHPFGLLAVRAGGPHAFALQARPPSAPPIVAQVQSQITSGQATGFSVAATSQVAASPPPQTAPQAPAPKVAPAVTPASVTPESTAPTSTVPSSTTSTSTTSTSTETDPHPSDPSSSPPGLPDSDSPAPPTGGPTP